MLGFELRTRVRISVRVRFRVRVRIRIRVGCNSWVLQLGVRVRISG